MSDSHCLSGVLIHGLNWTLCHSFIMEWKVKYEMIKENHFMKFHACHLFVNVSCVSFSHQCILLISQFFGSHAQNKIGFLKLKTKLFFLMKTLQTSLKHIYLSIYGLFINRGSSYLIEIYNHWLVKTFVCHLWFCSMTYLIGRDEVGSWDCIISRLYSDSIQGGGKAINKYDFIMWCIS